MSKRYFWRQLLALGAVVTLSGCNMTPDLGALSEPFNKKAAPETPAVQTQGQQTAELAFYQCRDEVVEMDRTAALNASLAQYLASANAINGCLAQIGPTHSFITQQQMMQLQALAVLNYLKGGDIENSRKTLETFKQAYQGRDLYFADNSSFIDTFDLLLNDKGLGAEQVNLNVNKTLLAEFQRKQYWTSH